MSSSIKEGINNFTDDIKNPNTSIKDSAKKRFNETFDKVKKNIQIGKGIKRKKKLKNTKNKRIKNIYE